MCETETNTDLDTRLNGRISRSSIDTVRRGRGPRKSHRALTRTTRVTAKSKSEGIRLDRAQLFKCLRHTTYLMEAQKINVLRQRVYTSDLEDPARLTDRLLAIVRRLEPFQVPRTHLDVPPSNNIVPAIEDLARQVAADDENVNLDDAVVDDDQLSRIMNSSIVPREQQHVNNYVVSFRFS